MLDVWIISCGGVGCTYVNEYLKKYTKLNINCDKDFDNLKHPPLPIENIGKKVLLKP